jgi:ankyrin repeat protein
VCPCAVSRPFLRQAHCADRAGLTPLHYAAAAGDRRTYELLVGHHTDEAEPVWRRLSSDSLRSLLLLAVAAGDEGIASDLLTQRGKRAEGGRGMSVLALISASVPMHSEAETAASAL